MILSERIVRSANAVFVSLIVEEFSIFWALESFFNSPARSIPWSTQIFLVYSFW